MANIDYTVSIDGINDRISFFELKDEQLLTKLPWMFDGRDLCDYIKRKYSQVKIESKPE